MTPTLVPSNSHIDIGFILSTSALVHPLQLEVLDFSAYDLIIDARSPREFTDDHIPSAINLPVVNDDEYAEVGTQHRTDPHRAYVIGVTYSLANIAQHVAKLIQQLPKDAHVLVYCFRGGKRSKLWADALNTIGFRVDVLRGGWKNYRRWVLTSLETLPKAFTYRVLAGSTGTGKTRLLKAIQHQGAQVLDLEDLAEHRGSVLGGLPGVTQPSQKLFDSRLLAKLREYDPARPVWLEAESKKIGRVQLPAALFDAMHQTRPILVTASMPERVRLWREDYPHWAQNPTELVRLMSPMKDIISGAELSLWQQLADEMSVDALFEKVMTNHYDPCYARSLRNSYKAGNACEVTLESLDPAVLMGVAKRLDQDFGTN